MRLSLVSSMSIGYVLEIVDVAILFDCAKSFSAKLTGIGRTRASDALITPLPESAEDTDKVLSQIKLEGLAIGRLADKLKADPRARFIAKARQLQL
jgi:hypothetical protein